MLCLAFYCFISHASFAYLFTINFMIIKMINDKSKNFKER